VSAAAPVYFDYAATTAVDPLVAAAMLECLGAEGDFANPSSASHALGRRAHAHVERARAAVAALIGAEASEIVFTSGATESNNLAILGVARANADRGRHIVTSRIEHRAVLDPCRRLEKEGFSVTYIEPDRDGRIAPDAVAAALRPDTVLVSLMQVNNELGVIYDIATVGAVCRARDIVLHTDAAQAAGKVAIDVRALSVDLLSITAHKFYGPKGIGALYVRAASRGRLMPLSFGGGQERGLRPGTLATHQIVGLGIASTLARERLGESGRRAQLQERLWRGISLLSGVYLNAAHAPRVPDILSVSIEGVDGESLVAGLSELALSTGSACSSASAEPSYVLRALGRNSALAQSTLRFSIGTATTSEDIDRAISAVRREVRRLREASPAFSAKLAPNGPNNALSASIIQDDALNPAVRALFDRLPGAGALAAGPGVMSGEAGSVEQGAWVRFHLQVENSVVKAARFQAYGCPHTLAVSAWLTEQLQGRKLSDLSIGEPSNWARVLSVPVEKLGRLLVVEDALQATVMPQPLNPA
jgi:cysteine desulfurase